MDTPFVRIVAFLIGFGISLPVGILCLFYPQKVQNAKRLGPINLEPPFEWLRHYQAQPLQVLRIRVSGIVFLGFAIVGAYAIVRALEGLSR
jgi:hypothetical protein